MLIAGREISVARAFVTGPPAARGHESGRKLTVARRVKSWLSRGNYIPEVQGKSDEELHELIATGRKKIFNFRMEKFRKTKPSSDQLLQWQYKIAVAKTILNSRKPVEEEAPEKTLTEAMETNDIPGEPTFTKEKADWEFWARHQVGKKLRNTVPKNWKWIQHYRKNGQKGYNEAIAKRAAEIEAYTKAVQEYKASQPAKTAQSAMPAGRSPEGPGGTLFAGSAGAAALGLSAAAAVFTLAGRRR